jgi:hypothetical protein
MHGDLHVAIAHHRTAIAWTGLLFGALGLAGLYAACRPPKGSAWQATELVLYIAVPLVATLLLNWQNAKAFNVRYVLIGLPMYLVLIAAGIHWLRREPRVMAMIFVLTTTGIALFNYYSDPARQKEDVRDAVRAVEAGLQPGECIFAPTVWQIVAHYQATPAPLHYVYREPVGVMERQLQDLFSSCPSFWYVRARPWVDDPDGIVLSAIESRYHAVQEMDFPGVHVIHFSSEN